VARNSAGSGRALVGDSVGAGGPLNENDDSAGGGAPELCSGGAPEPPKDAPLREKGVSLARKMQAGACIPAGERLEKAGAGPTSGPTRRLSHLATLIEQSDLSLVGSILTMEAVW
jgi:hypothetical protein